MTQETVIHGASGGTSKLARCGKLNPETVTVNLALYTCDGCRRAALREMREELHRHREAILRITIDLQRLVAGGDGIGLLVAAERNVEAALVYLDAQLAADASDA